MKNSFECIVIGGGVSGTAAAFELSQLGHEVALLEENKPHHQQACGEFISDEAIQHLRQMGISLDAAATKIQFCRLVSPRIACTIPLPRPGRGISRVRLDDSMIKRAEEAGAVVERGVTVKKYALESNGEYRIKTGAGDFFTKNLFVATGKQDLNEDPQDSDQPYIGMKMHFRLTAGPLKELQNYVMLFTYPAGYGGLTLIEPGVANCSFIFKKRVFSLLRGHYDEIRAYLEYFNPEFGRMLKGANLASEIFSASDISYGYLKPDFFGDENLYYLGDHSAVIPSLTGNGIAIALLSARISALVYDRKSKGESEGLHRLTRTLERQIRWSSFGHRLYKTPPLMDLAILITRFWPRCPQIILEKTRCPKINEIA